MPVDTISPPLSRAASFTPPTPAPTIKLSHSSSPARDEAVAGGQATPSGNPTPAVHVEAAIPAPIRRNVGKIHGAALAQSVFTVGAAVAAATVLPVMGTLATWAVVGAAVALPGVEAISHARSKSTFFAVAALKAAVLGIAIAALTVAVPSALLVAGAASVAATALAVSASFLIAPQTLRNIQPYVGGLALAGLVSLAASFIIPGAPALYTTGLVLFGASSVGSSVGWSAEIRSANQSLSGTDASLSTQLSAPSRLTTLSASGLLRILTA